MLKDLSTAIELIFVAMQKHLAFSLKIVAVLWLVHLINHITRYKLNALGLRVRSVKHLPGILLSPFLHTRPYHLIVNTVPLFILSNIVLLDGKKVFCIVTFCIIVFSGLLVWLFGRKGQHVGSSGIIMGYLWYVATSICIYIPNTAVVWTGVILYLLGKLVLYVFYSRSSGYYGYFIARAVSREWHGFGVLVGVLTAILLSLFSL